MDTKTPEQLAADYATSQFPDEGPERAVWRMCRDDFLAAYEAAKPKWISVKDRLPTKQNVNDIVLVWNAYDRDVSTVRWKSNGFDDVNPMYISHWMPLPKVPEDKGKAHWQELREFWKLRNVNISEWKDES